MNKRIDFTKIGGFPVTQYTTNWMQDSYRSALSAIAQMIGDKVILTGLEINGAQATNGWISYNGELLPFVGGAVMATFIIEEVKESRVFNDNESKEVYFNKRARFGSPGIAFSTLTRFGTVAGLWQKGDLKDIVITTQEMAADFDAFGVGRNGRAGWGLCDGQGGRPNLSGRVTVSYDPTQPEFNTLGYMGGATKHTLTEGELPVHGHGLLADNSATSGGVPYAFNHSTGVTIAGAKRGSNTYTIARGDGVRLVQTAGNNQSHNNLQPYFVALKIIKL